MKIFISWSKQTSQQIAEELKELVQCVLQGAEVFLSLSNIDSGARWITDISDGLSDCNYGLLCLTKENLNEPWLLFEAGAISKALQSHVVPLLFGLAHSDINFPIKQFQGRLFEKDEFLRLFQDMNKQAGSLSRKDDQLIKMFEKFWPDFAAKTELLLKEIHSDTKTDMAETDLQKLIRITSEMQNQLVSISTRLAKNEQRLEVEHGRPAVRWGGPTMRSRDLLSSESPSLTRLSLNLDKQTIEAIENLQQQNSGRSTSELIKKALSSYIEQKERDATQSDSISTSDEIATSKE